MIKKKKGGEIMGHSKKSTTVLVPQEVVESRILLIKQRNLSQFAIGSKL